MDAIEALDWGTYAFFRFQANQHPEVLPIMQAGSALGSYLAIGVVLLLTVLLFAVLCSHRSVLATVLSGGFALGLVEGTRYLVPRRRPEDAAIWLGSDQMTGSYPSAGIFLFTLSMILLGVAVQQLTTRTAIQLSYAVLTALLIVWLCLSQLFLCLHFLTDLLGGLAGAGLASWIALRLFPTNRAG